MGSPTRKCDSSAHHTVPRVRTASLAATSRAAAGKGSADCATLGKFYDNLRLRCSAYLNHDGSGSSGWETMVRKVVADPVDVELGRISQKYQWTKVRNRPAVRTEIATSLEQDIAGLVESNAQGHYFDNFSVLVKKPERPTPTC